MLLKVIMNPPYNGSLHLKILNNVINSIKDAEIVNLSPIRWLQDPLAEYKKNSNYKKFSKIRERIADLDVIDAIDATDTFNAGMCSDLGVYTIAKKGGWTRKENEIIKKVIGKMSDNLDNHLDRNKRDGWRWQTSDIQPITAQGGKKGSYGWYRRFCIYNHLRSTIYYNGQKDNKDWSTFNSGIKREDGSPIPMSIRFGTEEEAQNFENSLKTNFYSYLVFIEKTDQHTPFKFLPFMPDYSHSWSDNDLYSYFDLTKDEINIIESTINEVKSA